MVAEEAVVAVGGGEGGAGMAREQLAFRSREEGGGRRLLVGMKLNTSCREMLTWTIAKLAQPGDHILALHVSEMPLREGKRSLSGEG